MYLMYVDESGDVGTNNSPTQYFALSSIVVHESHWRDLLNGLVAHRRTLRDTYKLPMRSEIHASEYIRHAPAPGIEKFQRLAIMRNLLDELAKMSFISITSVVVDKNRHLAGADIFSIAWRALFQRFENTINYANFPGQHRADKGMAIVDNTDGKKLQALVRRLAVYNPVPNGAGSFRMMPLVRIIEDAHNKNSADSYIIQACDVCAYFLRQRYEPCAYVKKQSARLYYDRLRPVLNLKASISNKQGIVNL